MSPHSQPTLLLVRPEMRQAADMEVCRRLGWNVLPFAPLKIERLPEQASLWLQQMQRAEVVFWVSPTAVDVAATMLAECSGSLNMPNTLFRQPENTIYSADVAAQPSSGSLKEFGQLHIAVGKATATRLREYGVQNVVCHASGNDSEAVLSLPVWNRLPEHARVLIVRGKGGREWLAQQLVLRGFVVEKAEIYQRVPCALDWTTFTAAQPRAAWVTSSELAHELFRQTPPTIAQKVQSLLYFAHHARVCTTLRDLGAQNVFEAENLFAALNQLNSPFS